MDEKNDFQGIRITFQGCPMAIGIEDWSWAGLKKPVLYFENGNHRYKVASFNSRDTAEEFIEAVETIIQYMKGMREDG
jgi:hypothetical protein